MKKYLIIAKKNRAKRFIMVKRVVKNDLFGDGVVKADLYSEGDTDLLLRLVSLDFSVVNKFYDVTLL